jgi:tetratricopeptide (TPR) repeat protein
MGNDVFGKVVRKVREEKGIKLEEAAKWLSCDASTISRFERGQQKLDKQKLDLLLERLGIYEENLPKLIAAMELKEAISLFVFRAVETQVRHNALNRNEFYEKIAAIKQPILVSYLRAKRYFVKYFYEDAIRCFQSILDSNEEEYIPMSNMKSASHLDLSVIAYYNNDYRLSLEHLENGLLHFSEDGERQYIRYSLYYNKANVLEELGELKEAETALEPAWLNEHLIEDTLTRIKVFLLKASFATNRKDYDKSIEILQRALAISNINRDADASYYVLVDLGKLAFEMDLAWYSEKSYEAALALKGELRTAKPNSAYIGLSKLFLFQHRTKEAKVLMNEAISAALTDNKNFSAAQNKNKNILSLIQAYITLGNIYEREENKHDSGLKYKEALKLANKYNFDQYKTELYEYISRCNN